MGPTNGHWVWTRQGHGPIFIWRSIAEAKRVLHVPRKALEAVCFTGVEWCDLKRGPVHWRLLNFRSLWRLTRICLTLCVISGKPGSYSAVHSLLKVHPILLDAWRFPAYPWRSCAALGRRFVKRTSAAAVIQTPAAAQSRRRDSVGNPDAGVNAKILSSSDAGDAVNMKMVCSISSDTD